jgi:hypothetical protein
MPLLTPQNKKQSIAKLIAKINSHTEVAKRDVNALLTEDLKTELETLRLQQQKLKKIKKPTALNQYEKLHKQALMLFGRYDNYVVSAKVIGNVIVDRRAKKAELADKTKLAIKKAQDCLIHAIKTNKDLAKWLDKDTAALAKDIDLQYDLLPFVITSRSNDKLIDVKERFGLKTIREMRLEILNKALVLVGKEIDDWNETNGFTKQLTQEQTALLKTKLVHLKKTR